MKQPLRFQGQYYDHETGLHYNRHRYYDPHSGRFVSKDPIGLRGGINALAYVKSPTHWVDPKGLEGFFGKLGHVLNNIETIDEKSTIVATAFNDPNMYPISEKPPTRADGSLWGSGCGDVDTDHLVPDVITVVYNSGRTYSFDLTQPCKYHDEGYSQAGNFGARSKEACDYDLKHGVYQSCMSSTSDPILCARFAQIYYQGVKRGGKGAWDRAKKANGH